MKALSKKGLWSSISVVFTIILFVGVIGSVIMNDGKKQQVEVATSVLNPSHHESITAEMVRRYPIDSNYSIGGSAGPPFHQISMQETFVSIFLFLALLFLGSVGHYWSRAKGK